MENDSLEQQADKLLPQGLYAQAATVKGVPARTANTAASGGGVNIANLSDEELLSAINAPLTGEEVAVKMAHLNEAGIDINANTISFDEFNAYEDWRRKQHFSFWGAVGDGIATAAVDLGKGVASTVTDPKKLATLAVGSLVGGPAAGITAAYGTSLVEGFARGTRDLGGLFVMAANHPSSPLYRMFINPDGDRQQAYQDFLDLAEWNGQTEKILKGQTNVFMPDRSTYEKLLGKKLGGTLDDFVGVNNHLATAASYVLDPTLWLTMGTGSASKAAAKAVAAKAGTAALKSGHAGSHVAGVVAANAARNQFKATWLNSVGGGMVKLSELVTKPLEATYEAVAKAGERVFGVKPHITPISGNVNLPRVNPSAGHAPASFTHGVLGAAGVYSIFQIPYAIPIASVYGAAKAVGFVGSSLADLGKATGNTAAKGVAQAALHTSSVFGGYMAELAKTTVKGGIYGGLIGGVAAGEEGAAGGIGTGVTLGAVGHNVAALSGTISGKFSKMQIMSEFRDRVEYYKKKGFILQAENLQKFYSDIANEHGEDAAIRLASQILTLEKGKNTSVAFLSVNDMRKTLEMNPDFYTEVDVPPPQGQAGPPQRKKVLNELGKLVLQNGEAGGALWNGLFVEVDPKTGEIINTPISQMRDRKSGKYHIVINIDALRYARDENGNIIFDEIKGVRKIKGKLETTTTGETTRTYQEQVEGPRAKTAWDDPTVPRDMPTLVDKEGKPVPAEPFTPAPVIKTTAERISGDYGLKSLIDKIQQKIGNAEKVQDLNTTNVRKEFLDQGFSEEIIDKAFDAVQKNIDARKQKNAPKKEKLRKLEKEYTELTEQHRKRQAELDKNPDSKKQAQLDKEVKEAFDKITEARNESTRVENYGDNANFDSLVDRTVLYLRNIEPENRRSEFEAELVNKFTKYFDIGVDGKRTPEQQKRFEQLRGILENQLIAEGLMSKDGRFEAAKPTAEAPKKTVDKEFGLTVDTETGLAEIPFEIKTQKNVPFGEKPPPVEIKKGTTTIIDQGGRKMVLKSVNGIIVPFYLSTGDGGKKNVPAGKWYPFFGIDLEADGAPWLNKTSEAEIAAYYNSPELKKAAQELDSLIGDIRNTDKGQRVGIKGVHMDVINRKGEWGVSRDTAEGRAKLRQNIDNLKAEIAAASSEAAKPTAEAPKQTVGDTLPSRRQRFRSKDVFGPAKPITVTRTEQVSGQKKQLIPLELEVPTTRKVPRLGSRVETATLSELYHLMNKVRRRAEIGTEINSVVSRWLFGDANGEGWAFKDRTAAAQFMRESFDRLIGPRGRDSQMALDWKSAIDSYEKTGKVDPAVQDAFDIFLEELGESIFIGWENGKPFDYVFRGGDLGTVRNLIESLKDRMTNVFERNAVNLGADISTKQAFFDWFKKTKAGGKFRFDPHMESAFNDLIRIYQDKGMKNNGRTYNNLYTMSPAAVKEQAEYYNIEERISQDKDGNWQWKSPETYHREVHENALLLADELFALGESDPEALNGLDFYIFDSKGNMSPSVIEGRISRAMETLQKRSESDFDPITQRTLDSQGSLRGDGFLFSSADAKNIGPSLDDIVNAQISNTRKTGRYKERPAIQQYGNRGRPRTSLSGNMLAEAREMIKRAKGKSVLVFRGIPTEKAFRIINKYVPKQVSNNVRMLAPIIADGGVSAPNVINGQYLGFEQDQGGGVILSREKGETFGAREVNFVPYEMEFRITLKDPKNPTVDYKRPHFAFVTRAYDVDALNRRIHIIWNENLEVRQAYDNINDYIKDVHATMSEYSGSGMIPAVRFFGADEYKRDRRKYVVAAIGAHPNKDVQGYYQHEVSVGEADWHEMHFRNAIESVNHPWMSLRLDNLSQASAVEGEGIPNIRVNEKMYQRSMIPTPTDGESAMMEGMYSAGDESLIIRDEKDESRIAKLKNEIQQTQNYINRRLKLAPIRSLDPNTKNGRWIVGQTERIKALESEIRKLENPAPRINDSMLSSGDGPIPLKVESIPDFHDSTEDGPFDYYKTLKNLNKPSKLIKILDKHPAFNVKDKVFDFQSAEDFDSRSEMESNFLKSNFKWAVDKGDIFKAESVKRYVSQFGKEGTLVRHTLDEHLDAGGTIETYNSNFKTGNPAVFTANFAQFKPDFFGPKYKGSNADTINAHLFSGRQSTVSRNMEGKDSSLRTLVGLKNPLVYDMKGEGKGSVSIERIHKNAIKNGHDGVIFQNVYEGGIMDNLVTLSKGAEGQVLVLDQHLRDIPLPRNSGHNEGAVVMFSAGDAPKLPEGAFGPNNPETVNISRGLKALKGMKSGDGKFIIKLNPDKSRKIGAEYETMKHDPHNPKVKAAYEALAKETEEQYQAIIDAGYMPEMHMSPEEPYPNSRATIADIRNRKRLKVFSTDYGYGETPITQKDISENPMLRMSKFKDANGVPMRVNDLFRFVHDFFGHSERGNSFGPLGEENAWDVHARMFSPLARRAMTSETRGQNSWVNFIHEPNIEINRMRDAARRLEREGRFQEAMELRATIGSTRFADQKIGLMPEWTSKLDEELTPIETELYGRHVTSDATYGVYSAGDYAENIWAPSAEEFVQMSAKARASHKFGTSVDVKNPNDLAGHQLFTVGEGKAFAYISPDGELGGVLKGLKGTAQDVVAVVEAALKTGKVKWLSAFDTVLPEMYNKFGFEAVSRIKFVDEYRPDGWDYTLYSQYNGGRPDVVFMSYVGDKATPYYLQKGRLVGSYDDAAAIAKSASSTKGMFSTADTAGEFTFDPNDFDKEKLTHVTKDRLQVIDLLSQYKEHAKALRAKMESGEMTEAQVNMALNAWHKKNATGQTALSWKNHNIDGTVKPVESLVDEDISAMKHRAIKDDANFKKEVQLLQKEAVKRVLAQQSIGEPPAPDAPRIEHIKYLFKKKHRDRMIEWLRSQDADFRESVYSKYIKDWDMRKGKSQESRAYENKVRKLASNYATRIEAEINKEIDLNPDDKNNPYYGKTQEEIRQMAEEIAIAEAIAKIDELDKLQEETPMFEGDISLYEQELAKTIPDKETRKALVERRLQEVREEIEPEEDILVERTGILSELSLENAIKQIQDENRKYREENGEDLWAPEEIESEAQRMVSEREQILKTFSESSEPETKRMPVKGSLEFMIKYQFAGTKWFDLGGNSLVWKGEKTGTIYEGFKATDDSGKQTIGGKDVKESVVPVYPPEMEKAITDLQERLKEHLNGERGYHYHDNSMTLFFDLFRLWGFEPNELLREVDFRPRSKGEATRIATEEGKVGRELRRQVNALTGMPFVDLEGNAILTERLEALPDLFELTRDVISIVKTGAEIGEGKALSEIEITNEAVTEMLKEFARQYPQYAKYVIIEGGTDVDAYVKRNWESAWKVAKNKWKKANNWEKGKDIPPDVSAKIKSEIEASLKAKAIGSIQVRKGWLGEDSVKSEIYKILIAENQRKKKLMESRPRNPETGMLLPEYRRMIDPETGEVLSFSTPESVNNMAVALTREIKFRFIEFLGDKANEIINDNARLYEEQNKLVELSSEEIQKKRIEERKKAVEEAKVTQLEPEVVETPEPVRTPEPEVVKTPEPPVFTERPKQTVITDITGQKTEKQKNAENLQRAIAEAIAKGNVRDVKKPTLTPPVGGEAQKPKPTQQSKPKMPTDYGYTRDANGDWSHPNKRWVIRKKDGKYLVIEKTKAGDGIMEVQRAIVDKFVDADSVVAAGIAAQTPPPMPTAVAAPKPSAAPKPTVATPKPQTPPVAPTAPTVSAVPAAPTATPKATEPQKKPVGRPKKPVAQAETPKPVKTAIENDTQRQVEANTVRSNEDIGKAQAKVLQAGVVGASDPAVAPAANAVLTIKDEFTLEIVQGVKGMLKTPNGRYTVQRGRNGLRVAMNDHISPITNELVEGRIVAFVNSTAEAQLAIREWEFYMRRMAEARGINVGQILQALNPVRTPDQINKEAQEVSRIAQQYLGQMAGQGKPAIDNAAVALAKDALRKLGMLQKDIDVYLPLALNNGIDPSDVQGILKFVLTKGQVRSVYASSANQIHAATVNANAPTPSTPTITIMPTANGIANATGGAIPATLTGSQTTTSYRPVPSSLRPFLSGQQLAVIRGLGTFTPHKSTITLANGSKAKGTTYVNAAGYSIVQSGIAKWRVYNPAASLIAVVDDEQDACNEILKDFYKR